MLIMASSFSVVPYLTIAQTDTATSLSYILTLIRSHSFRKSADSPKSLDTVSSHGQWRFFPFILLIRPPLSLLITSVWALLVVCFRRKTACNATIPAPTQRRIVFLLLLTIALYGGVALFPTYNWGFRHLLPVLPLLFLPVAMWASQCLRYSCILVSCLLAETIALTPLWMSATNTWWLGKYNPTWCAVITDCEYSQNFLVLVTEGRWRGIGQ